LLLVGWNYYGLELLWNWWRIVKHLLLLLLLILGHLHLRSFCLLLIELVRHVILLLHRWHQLVEWLLLVVHIYVLLLHALLVIVRHVLLLVLYWGWWFVSLLLVRLVSSSIAIHWLSGVQIVSILIFDRCSGSTLAKWVILLIHFELFSFLPNSVFLLSLLLLFFVSDFILYLYQIL
jgi:hypothetical protein